MSIIKNALTSVAVKDLGRYWLVREALPQTGGPDKPPALAPPPEGRPPGTGDPAKK